MSTMRIFVSHSHTNNSFCAELVRTLRTAGADVWYDDESLRTGQLGPIIERELRERPVFIVVLSHAALASRWVEDETRWAYNRLRRDPTRIILPVLVEALADADDIWLFLQDFKRIEAPGPGCMPHPQAEAVTRTLHALELTLPGEAPLPTAPLPAESAHDLIGRGRALSAQKKYAEALPLFQRATQLDPRSFSAWFNFGYTLNSHQRYAEALVACDRALALDPHYAYAWSNKGIALWGLKWYDEALVAYDRALALDPNFAEAWFNKGHALNEVKRYDEALVAYDRALALDPNFAEAWNNKGIALRNLRRADEALTSYDRALALDPKNAKAWNNKGNTLGGLKRYDEALIAWDRALALDPHYVEAWFNKGIALRALGRTRDAEEAEWKGMTSGQSPNV